MNPNKALWEKGDFTRLARTMRGSGEALVSSLGVTQGMKVLDLGCVDGTTALRSARLGADVIGVDIARHHLSAGNKGAHGRGPFCGGGGRVRAMAGPVASSNASASTTPSPGRRKRA